MGVLSRVKAAVRNLICREQAETELDSEIRAYADALTDEKMAAGMGREEARRKTLAEMGGAEQVKQAVRDGRAGAGLETIWQDARFALRQLLKSPGFTVTALVTLALGIAVNATMFSMVSAFLIPRIPGHDAQHVVVLSSVNPTSRFLPDTNMVSAPNYLSWRTESQIFSEMAAEDPYRTGSLAGQGQTQAESVQYASVSPNYFALLGAAPQWGRSFAAGEDQAGRDHVAILSYGLWERRFHSDREVIGSTLRLNREDYTVVGVMGEDFRLMGFAERLWTPLTLSHADTSSDARRNRSLVLFARLQPGVTLAQVRAEVHRLAQQTSQDYPDSEKGWGAAARMLPDYLVYSFGIRNAMAVMMTVVGFILLIACGNVAGLLLTRAVGRQKELAIRMSLGASRQRVVRQLLTEGLVLALVGGLLGLLLSSAGISFLRTNLNFNDGIGTVTVRLDRNVLLFALAISLISAVLSSLVPALKASRTNINSNLKGDGRSATGERSQSRLRSVLVIGEIALAMALLIGSGLLIQGVYLLEHQKLGFQHDHLLTAGVMLDHSRYADAAKQMEFARGILTKLQVIPGVESAAIASNLPASGANSIPIQIRGEADRARSDRRTALDVVVTPEYLRVAGVSLLRGRGFTEEDNAEAPRVVLVNQEFVQRYLHGGDAIGKQMLLDNGGGSPLWNEIVGVVSDVKTFSEGNEIDPEVYQAFQQRPVGTFSLILRADVDPGSLTAALRLAVAQMDAELPLLRVMTMEEVIDYQRYGNPLFEKLLATFSLLALILAAVGIHGLIAYSVSQRTHEIGIRLALGASAADIVGTVLRRGLWVAAIGSAIGLVLGLPMPRLFDAMFVGLRFGSAVVYAAVAGTMLVVVVFATLLPARRAARVNPVKALRAE